MDLGFIVSNALTLACIYGTIAIGISLTWSSLGLVNMAYGFIFALSGYGAWLASVYLAPFRLWSWQPVSSQAQSAACSSAWLRSFPSMTNRIFRSAP